MPVPTPFSVYARVKMAESLHELRSIPFGDGINAFCWPRTLPGDFAEVVEALGAGEGVVPLDEGRLRTLQLSSAGRIARDILLEDHGYLRARGLAPELNLIHSYPRDDAPVAVDVYSFHADSAPVPAETWLCTYYGPPSEALRNEEAQRRIDDPETRAQLLQLFGGEDDESFREFLHENSYDLHYAPQPGAQPFSFGVGHLWRIAVEYPGSPVPPCIHRAPAMRPGDPPRLLMIS